MREFIDIVEGDEVAFDVETTGLDWKKDRPVGYVITVMRDAGIVSHYYPIRHETGPNMDPKKVVAWIKSWAGKKIHLVGHNLKFDLHFAANDGIYFPNATFEDTGINAALINEHMRGFSLDNCARTFGVTEKKGDALYAHIAAKFGGEPDRKQMGNYWRLPADDFLAVDYAEGDGVSTLELVNKQQEYLDADNLREVHALECRVIPVLFRMERRGVRVDGQNMERLVAFIDRQLAEATGMLPWDGFNVRSRSDVPKAFEELGITDFPRTPLGNPSFTEEWLSGNDLGRAIVQVRKLTNLQNSFIKPLLETHTHNGRVHTNYNQLRADEYGTITGRLSSNGPNMQQVPKRDKLLAPVFRSVFAPTDGMIWSQNDYSQQEYRVFAAYTGAKALVEGYAKGEDFHQTVANMLSVERDPTAKRLNLGMLYWMGVKLLAEKLGCSVEQAQAYLNMYHDRFPEVRGFLRRCQTAGRDRGYVMTIMGRKARFPDRNKAYQGSSRVIQGSCADLTKLKMCQVDEFLYAETGGKEGVMLQVHDELDWENEDSKAGMERDAEAKRIMSDFTDFPMLKVPMVVDGNNAADWGLASFPKTDWSQYV